MFNVNSGLVGIWVREVRKNPDSREKVPNLDNLQEVVFGILDGEENA